MSRRTCPLLAIAHLVTETKLGSGPICLEQDCTWWVVQKEHYECAFILLVQSIAAIGKLMSDGAIIRTVAAKT